MNHERHRCSLLHEQVRGRRPLKSLLWHFMKQDLRAQSEKRREGN
jgi:hypothetical protein